MIDLTGSTAAMDLVVRDVTVEPAGEATDIVSGGAIRVSWQTLNDGVSPTLGDFIERVIVRRASTLEVHRPG